ncbi:MAG: hypothetical protein ACOX8X_04470 [Methanomethylophilus sp.]|jgi:hypothetical protein
MPTLSVDVDDGTFDLLADYAMRNKMTVPEVIEAAIREKIVADMLKGM